MSDPREIAKKLTKAQQRTVLALTDMPAFAHRDRFSALAAFNLIGRGITKLGFDPAYLRDTYRLTPLGLQVRAILQSEASHD